MSYFVPRRFLSGERGQPTSGYSALASFAVTADGKPVYERPFEKGESVPTPMQHDLETDVDGPTPALDLFGSTLVALPEYAPEVADHCRADVQLVEAKVRPAAGMRPYKVVIFNPVGGLVDCLRVDEPEFDSPSQHSYLFFKSAQPRSIAVRRSRTQGRGMFRVSGADFPTLLIEDDVKRAIEKVSAAVGAPFWFAEIPSCS